MNECRHLSGLCQNGECINNDGSYRCKCKMGYKLDPTGKKCVGKWYCSRHPTCKFVRVAARGSPFAVRSSGFKFTGVTNNDNGEFMASGLANYSDNTTNQCYDWLKEEIKSYCNTHSRTFLWRQSGKQKRGMSKLEVLTTARARIRNSLILCPNTETVCANQVKSNTSPWAKFYFEVIMIMVPK